jgi:hypothetical protein
MKISWMIILIITVTYSAFAAEVVMVQRDFPMSNHEGEMPADVYVNGNYKVGRVLALSRTMFAKVQEKTQKLIELNIPFALIKIIFSEGSISIGRLVYVHERDKLPLIERYAPVVGDKVLKPKDYLLKGYKMVRKVSLHDAKPSQDPKQKRKPAGTEIVL